MCDSVTIQIHLVPTHLLLHEYTTMLSRFTEIVSACTHVHNLTKRDTFTSLAHYTSPTYYTSVVLADLQVEKPMAPPQVVLIVG